MNRVASIFTLSVVACLGLNQVARAVTVTGASSFDGTALVVPASGVNGGDAIRLGSLGDLSNYPPNPPESTPSLTTGGVTWVPQTPVTFSNITTIQATFKGLSGHIGGGSPRFSLFFDWNNNGVLDDGYETSGASHLFALMGSNAHSFQDPFTGDWETTANFVGTPDASWEIDQLSNGGYPYVSYDQALAHASNQSGQTIGDLVGNLRVMAISLVVDGGWNMPVGTEQQILLDNVLIEGFTPDVVPTDSLATASFDPQTDAPPGTHFFQETLQANPLPLQNPGPGAVPEPISAVLLLPALAGLAWFALRRTAGNA